MYADTDIQVWLETAGRTQPSIIVPYVQSSVDSVLRYSVRAVRDSGQGHSEITQGGMVKLPAGAPVALGKMSISRSEGDTCHVEVIFHDPDKPSPDTILNYRLPCPE